MLNSPGLVLSRLHGEIGLGKGRAQNPEKIGLLSVKFSVNFPVLCERSLWCKGPKSCASALL